MSVVVSDTGPLQYLLLVDAIEYLPKLYGKVYIPKTVYNEMLHKKSPAKLKKWAKNLPSWVVVKSVRITD